MTVENISWSNLHEQMMPTQQGSYPKPPDHLSDVHPTEPPGSADLELCIFYIAVMLIIFNATPFHGFQP